MDLKFGVVGTGHLGRLHTKFFNENEKAELIGIYDIDEQKASEVAKEFNTKSFADLEELLDNINAVSIVASTSAHYELMKKAIDKGLHILVEKPITSEIWQAEEILKEAEAKNLMIQVGHIERFNPALLSLNKYHLEPKFIETDRLAQFNPRGIDVAVIHDLMIHDIDIILNLIKSEVSEVRASGIAVVSDHIDIANARLEFTNGSVANVTASRISQKKMRKMRIFQKDAYITLDFIKGVSDIYRLVPPKEVSENHFLSFGEMGVGDKKKMIIYEQPDLQEVNALKYEIDLFVETVETGKEPIVTGYDGLQALKVADQIVTKIGEAQTT
jgi:predicted dehydrogenase